ncbi:response regulator transcription factor [Paratissierella segnis]|uniref:Response regulator transcription factor n=1 Tax=Paratissierella segnis TaxID=2763679 RepID=A0A926IKS1_9FIRM|nr:response regulator transcription factor [Paratissierella segnis]MBC8587968.1 response regulator transcription factor [Paratissierella segnis]
MEHTRILVVDDDREIANAIDKLLRMEGYDIIKAYNGLEALDVLISNNIQLILLDIMMPKLDGLSTILRIREKKNIPIIIISAKSEDSDKILGLSMGADDYVTKPFNPQELLARIKSQLRRYMFLGDMGNIKNSSQLIVGGLTLDKDSKQLFVDGEEVRLTPTEYKIMDFLMTNAGVVFSAEKIYEKVWEEPAYSVENTVMVHIRRIREKIEINPKEPKYLKVVWGIGYKIEKY